MELILKICALTFVACIMVAIINLVLLRKTATEGMDTSVTASAEAFSDAIENAIQTYKTKVESIANETPITPDMTFEEVDSICNDFEKTYDFLHVSFVNSKGVPYDVETLDLSGREYFKVAMSGTTYISSPLVTTRPEANKAVVLYLAAKVNNRKYDGIALVELSNNLFSQIIKEAKIGDKGYGFVIDKTGTIVAHKDNSLVESFTNYIDLGKKDSAYAGMGSFISEMVEKKTGEKSIYFEGSHKYIAYTPIEGPEGWILAMVADKDEMMAPYRGGILISLAVLALLIFASGVVAVLIARSIGNPVRKIAEAADRLAVGDLDVNVDVSSKNEIGSLAESFKNLVESTRTQALAVEQIADGDYTVEVEIRSDKDLLGRKLSEMVQKLNLMMMDIATAADQVSAGSKQIADSSMALSQGATEQASSIEELSASIEEVSAQTKENAQNASKANELADLAKDYAINGNEQMKRMLKAMDDINESSSNINKIIKVIDDIAFQTNILALNAAVEAARAGQHGKGFAVVAEEVRTLAGRSANAAKETTALIEDSIKKSEEGTRIAKDTAEALEKIFEEVKTVSDLVSCINNASDEQAAAIAQINQGIMQVSQVVQENSATSEESAAASEELASQAEALKEIVGQARLKRGYFNGDSYEKVNPEVLQVIEKMSEKKTEQKSAATTRKKSSKSKESIVLSDKEFGKY
jgi:methyl-accepting chemotaxis protein